MGAGKASASGLNLEERKRGIEDQDDEWGAYAARIKRRAGATISATAAITATPSGAEMNKEKPDIVDFDKLDVNLGEEEPRDVVPECEYDGVNEEAEETWDPEAILEVRSEKSSFMKELVVWEEASREEHRRNTGREPISTKWVDANKGRNGQIQTRSKVVARELRTKGDDRQFDVSAAMPPLEMKRMLFRVPIVDGDLKSEKGGSERKQGHTARRAM
jgi:hypothetical protein